MCNKFYGFPSFFFFFFFFFTVQQEYIKLSRKSTFNFCQLGAVNNTESMLLHQLDHLFYSCSISSTDIRESKSTSSRKTFSLYTIRRRSDYIIGFIAPAIGPNKSKKLTRLIALAHNIHGKV